MTRGPSPDVAVVENTTLTPSVELSVEEVSVMMNTGSDDRQEMTMVQVDRMMKIGVDNTRTPSGEVSTTGVEDESCSSLDNTEILLSSMDKTLY